MSKTYTADEVARGLAGIAAANGNLRQAARDTGFSRTTLRAWLAGRLPRGITREDVNGAQPEANRQVAGEWREVERLYLGRLRDPEVVARTSAQQAAIIGGIASDKATRAEGGPTSISESRQVRISLVEPDALRSDNLRVIEGGRRG